MYGTGPHRSTNIDRGLFVKTILTHAAAVILTAAVAGAVFHYARSSAEGRHARAGLASARLSVERAVAQHAATLQRQLDAFCDVAAHDRDFAMKILVENDRSAPEVTELAPRFLAPMDMWVLEITDSALVVLSSGHFPMNVGNAVPQKASLPVGQAFLFEENIRGRRQLTWQMKAKFAIEGMVFYCFGGRLVDSTFLCSLTPSDEVEVVLRRGDRAIGSMEVESVSAIKENAAVVNNTLYLADSVSLFSCGEEQSSVLLVLIGAGRQCPIAPRAR
jgi:hypothetical protein